MENRIRHKRIFYQRCLVILFSIFYFLFSSQAHAAELYFGSHSKEVTVGQTFEVGVFLNTDGESVNAVEGRVSVGDKLVVKAIRDGNSFVSLWVERPHVVDNAAVFSGIIPGGYQGREAYLFSVVLEAKKSGSAVIASADESVLLNDGEGSAAKLRRSPLALAVTDIGVVPEYKREPDDTPPEAFTPELGQDSALFNGRWFAAFAAQDKQSGIDHYEAYESARRYSPEALAMRRVQWQRATSPYLLVDQTLRSFVYVKAVDRAGNSRIGILPPKQPLPWYENIIIWSILAVVSIFLLVTWRRRSTQRQ